MSHEIRAPAAERPFWDAMAQAGYGWELVADGHVNITRDPARAELGCATRGLYGRHLRLEALPDEIGALAELRHIDVSANSLTALPGAIGALRELRSLNVDSNRLTELPDSLGALRELKCLFASGNPLVAPPAWLHGLPRLEVVNFNHSSLTKRPDWRDAIDRLAGRGVRVHHSP